MIIFILKKDEFKNFDVVVFSVLCPATCCFSPEFSRYLSDYRSGKSFGFKHFRKGRIAFRKTLPFGFKFQRILGQEGEKWIFWCICKEGMKLLNLIFSIFSVYDSIDSKTCIKLVLQIPSKKPSFLHFFFERCFLHKPVIYLSF